MAVSRQLYTVEEIAERLHLHVKTIRRYIADGKLKAKRIGKEYRVTRADLHEFEGGADAVDLPISRSRHVVASTIVDIDVMSPREVERVRAMVTAVVDARKAEGDDPRADCIHFPDVGRMRITITGSLPFTASIVRVIDATLEDVLDSV